MEPAARAADRARIQALFLCRGCGPAVVAGSVQAPGWGSAPGAARGVSGAPWRWACCPDDAAGRLAVAGHGLVSVCGTGYQVREVARSSSP